MPDKILDETEYWFDRAVILARDFLIIAAMTALSTLAFWAIIDTGSKVIEMVTNF